jgi:hypothetical protein
MVFLVLIAVIGGLFYGALRIFKEIVRNTLIFNKFILAKEIS